MKRNYYIILYCVFLSSISFSQSVDSLFVKATNMLQGGKYHEADSLFTVCIIKSERGSFNYFSSFYNRGLSRMYQGNLDSALDDFKACEEMNNKNYNVYHALSECYLYKKEFDLSLKYVDYATYINPKKTDIYIIAAKAAYSIVDLDRGIEYCTKALKIKKDPRFYGIRSMLYLANGKVEYAKNDIQTGAKLFGEDEINILEAKVYFAYTMNQTADFEKYAKKLTSLEKNYPLFMSLEVDYVRSVTETE